jgi:cysteine-rich repeat protein
VRAGIVLLVAAACGSDRDVPCNGVLEPGELCDDGNASDGDGCDCATRAIELAPLAPGAMATAVPTVIAEDGAWCWFQDERAIVDGDKLVVASISHGGDVQVSSLALSTGERTQAQLHTRLERDDHDVPSLLALPDGRVAAFYTRHDGFPYIYRRETTVPGDLTAWNKTTSHEFGYDVTYTNPFSLSSRTDRLYMFIRGHETNPTLLVSNNLGVSWNEGGQLLDAGERGFDGRVFDHRPYVKYASDGVRTIHLVYTDGHPAEYKRNSIYHMVYRDDALFTSDGTRLASAKPTDAPHLEPSRGTLVYDGSVLPGGQAWTWDTAIDGDGHPVAVFSTFPDPARSFFDHQYRYAHWDGTAWRVHRIAYAGTGIYHAEGFYSGGIALDPDDTRIVYFASNVEPVSGEPTATGVFEIYRGITDDGGATWRISAVTSGSHVSNLRPIVPEHHADPTTVLWLRGSYDTYLEFHTQVVALVGDATASTTTPAPQPADLVALARFDLAATVYGPATPTAPGFVAAVPAAGYALAEDRGISLLVSNITGTREAVTQDPLYRGLAYCDRGGYAPADKLRVDLAGLAPHTEYVVRVHGHDTANAYTKPTLWFRGDAKTLDSDDNAAFLTGHRNVNNTVAGEGYTDMLVRSDAAGRLALVARGLDYGPDEHVALLSALEVLQAPVTMLVARFDVDASPSLTTAPDAVSLSFDDAVAWSGEATMNGITARVTTDRIEALRWRMTDDPMLADFVYGRDQLVVDVTGLEPGKLYAITVYSTDVDYNQYAASRWRVDEPGLEPIVVHGFHMNLHRKDEGAMFTFYHRATASSFRLRGEDVITSLSSNPSVVIFNGMDIRVAQ